MLKLVYFVPESHLDVTKSAIFAVGAGKLGQYEHCCWQVQGMGQYRPLAEAQPFIGSHATLSQVEEYRVETLVDDCIAESVIKALLQTHPYETPAFELTTLHPLSALDRELLLK